MKKLFWFVVAMCLLLIAAHAQVPQQWNARGVGGGGALFSPSISPVSSSEYYVACDMSELFHSTDGGDSYDIVHFNQLQSGHHSKVCFTNLTNVRYCINYDDDRVFPVKSLNNGAAWFELPGNPDPYEETFSVFADYYHPDRVIIAYYNEIHTSQDGGYNFINSYNAANPGNGILIGGVFFDGDTVYMGTSDGLLVSVNGGNSFVLNSASGIPSTEKIYSFCGARKNGVVRLFCLTAGAGDVYPGLPSYDYWGLMQGIYSLDAGSSSWVSKMGSLASGNDFPMFIDMAENNTDIVYLAGSDQSSEPRIWQSLNAGTSWSQTFQTSNNANITTGWSGFGGDRGWGYGETALGFDVAMFDYQSLIFSDFGFVHRTTNGGFTWQQRYVDPADQNPSGSSTPLGKSYHSSGIENTTCWQVMWIDQNNLFACFSDIRGARSTDAGNSWNFNYTGHTQNSMYRIVKNNSNGILYAATSTIHDLYQSTRLQDNILDAASADGKIIYSANNGVTWNDLHDFSMPVFWIAMDPNNSNRMYASVVNHSQGLGGIYVTDDLQNGSSSSWTKLADPPRTEGHPAAIEVLNDGKVVCTYSGRRTNAGAFTASSGVFIYDPANTSWTDVSDPGMYYWTKDVVIDPYDPLQNTLYVCVFSGWGGAPNGLGGLYKTTDRGQSWTKINSLDRVTSVTFHPSNSNEIYLTTEQDGLWHSTNINAATPSFEQVQSYPFRQPERVFFNQYNQNEIWVTSFGNGMRVGDVSASGIEFSDDLVAISVYPNPVEEDFSLSFNSGARGEVVLELKDVRGKIVWKGVQNTFPGQNNIRVNRIGLKEGIYFISITTKYLSSTQKVLFLNTGY